MKEVKVTRRPFESRSSYEARVKETQKAQKEANYQNKLEVLTKEINDFNKKRFNSARHINNYEISIKEQIGRLKKNPNSKNTLIAVTRMLQLLIAKKLVTERYAEAVKNKVEELKICKRELQTSRGEEIIDNSLVEKLIEETQNNDTVISYLNDAAFSLDNLFRAYESSSLISGDLRDEVNDTVKSTIMSIIAPKMQDDTSSTNEVKKETSNNLMTEDEIDTLIKNLK